MHERPFLNGSEYGVYVVEEVGHEGVEFLGEVCARDRPFDAFVDKLAELVRVYRINRIVDLGSGSGVLTSASVVDSVTNDATTVPMKR